MVDDRVAVAGEDERDRHRAGLAQRLDIGGERLGALRGAVQRPRDQRVGGDVREQVVGTDQDLPLGVPEDRVGGAVAGPVEGAQGAVAEADLLAIVERAGHLDPRAPAAEAAGDAAQRRRHFLRDPVAQHQLDGEAVLRLGVLVEVGQALGGDADRRHLGTGVLGDDLDQAEVVDVLVGDDHQLEVVDRVAAGAELDSQLVERLARVGAGVDQGQRLVLDQVAVDPPDRERGRDLQPVDAGERGLLQRLLWRRRHLSPGSARGPRRGGAPCPRARPATRG